MSTWKAGVLFQNWKWFAFFTVGKSLAVISFAPRMIGVILKMLLQCGEIWTRYSQDATITRNWLKCESWRTFLNLVLVAHSSFAQIKKNHVNFGNGATWSDPYVTMVSNARREKLKKRESIMAGCSTFVLKVKRSRVVTSNGEIRREMKILLIQFAN